MLITCMNVLQACLVWLLKAKIRPNLEIISIEVNMVSKESEFFIDQHIQSPLNAVGEIFLISIA